MNKSVFVSTAISFSPRQVIAVWAVAHETNRSTAIMEESSLEVAQLVAELDSRAETGSVEEKITALKALRAGVDPTDQAYSIQRQMAAEGALEVLVRLLSSPEETVVCEAALSLAALTSNSQGVGLRLEPGQSFGLLDGQLLFNPVQDILEGIKGIRTLVDLLYSESASVQEAAQEALVSAGSFNHGVKLGQLKCLVHDIREGKKEGLLSLDRLITSMEIRDTAAVVLDQVILPVVRMLSDDTVKLSAVTVLGTIAEERPAAGSFLCEEGALPPVAQMIISDDPRLRDAGIHTMWHMVKKNKDVLEPEQEMLGVEASALVQPLVDTFQSAGLESDNEEKTFDNSDEALLILKALAEHNSTVRENVKELDLEPSRCTVM